MQYMPLSLQSLVSHIESIEKELKALKQLIAEIEIENESNSETESNSNSIAHAKAKAWFQRNYANKGERRIRQDRR